MKGFIAVHFILFLFAAKTEVQAQNTAIEKTGDIVLFVLPTVAVSTSIFKHDKAGRKQFAKSFLLNQTMTFGLKLAINKARPNMQNNNAFLSGHTSTTFQGAAFLQKRYGWQYGIPAYLLAGFTGYTRINADKHDIVDVLAGALLGVGCSYLFTISHDRKHMQLSLNSDSDHILICFNYTF